MKGFLPIQALYSKFIDIMIAIRMAYRLKDFDLNLLLVFKAIDRERNVSRAARELGLTQPALSQALARLREQLKDPLFVRSARGMVPTPKATELSPKIHRILETLGATLADAREFHPAQAERLFRLATTDYFELLALPALSAVLAREAPGVQIQTRSSDGILPKAELESGQLDLAIAGFYGDLPEGFYRQKLFEDDFACLVRRGHPLAAKKARAISVNDYATHRHAMISPQGDLKGRVDPLLAKQGKRRQISVALEGFAASGWIVARSDLVLTGPRRLLEIFASELPVKLLEEPFGLPRISVVQVWHARNHEDAEHRWLRTQIQKRFAGAA